LSLLHTRALVLRQTKFSDHSVILKTYTEERGLCPVMVRGVMKSKPAVSPALLQPLTLLDMVIYHKEGGGIFQLKEMKGLMPYTSLPFDIRKSSVALFIAELLDKSLKEEESNRSLFDFLVTSLSILDISKESVANFHCWFAMQLTRFLGFLPNGARERDACCFDLREGVFLSRFPDHVHFLDSSLAGTFVAFSTPGFREYYLTVLGKEDKKNLVRAIIAYYQLHVTGFGKMHAHEVLEEVLG